MKFAPILVTVVALSTVVPASRGSAEPNENAAVAQPTLRVQGRHLVDGAGKLLQLRGVNRAIFESRCTYDAGRDAADGPMNQSSVTAMRDWRINVARVTINEDCWLGINGLPLSGDTARYRTQVIDYVSLLRRNRLYVIVDAHVTAPGGNRSTRIDNMPDRDHLPAFWRSVAARLKADHGIIFDPVNEVAMGRYNDPHPSPPGQWRCWRDGCELDSMYGGRFAAAGLQLLVDTIRAEGATQPVMLGGLGYNSEIGRITDFLPRDPQHQLIASLHAYDFAQGNQIGGVFKNQIEPLAARLPVIIGELGELNCDAGTAPFTRRVLSLVDAEAAHGVRIGVLGWTWNAKTSVSTGWHCPTDEFGGGGPLLIRTYGGVPTVMGGVLRQWIESKSGSP